MLGLWRRFGVLVHPGSRFSESTLNGAVRQLPGEVRKLWKEVLAQGAWRIAEPTLPDLKDVQSADQLAEFDKRVAVACLDEVRACVCGVDVSQPSSQPEGLSLELCELRNIDETRAFRAVRDRAVGWIEAGDTVQVLWRERFSGLASVARAVAVVDRYCLAQLIDNPSGCGLKTFIDALATTATSSCRLMIIGERPSRIPVEQVENAVGALWSARNGTGASELRLIVSEELWQAHDRYVRFDDRLCVLGIGLEVLGGVASRRRSSFSLDVVTQRTRDCEASLRSRRVFERLWA
jgi:hypothetical protein